MPSIQQHPSSSCLPLLRQLHWTLKPLFFEVPTSEAGQPVFVGRRWLFREVAENLSSDLPTNGGVVISGAPGAGKTAVALQLVEHSCFGRAGAGHLLTTSGQPPDDLPAVESIYNQSQLSLAASASASASCCCGGGGGVGAGDSLRDLASKVSFDAL